MGIYIGWCLEFTVCVLLGINLLIYTPYIVINMTIYAVHGSRYPFFVNILLIFYNIFVYMYTILDICTSYIPISSVNIPI